MSVETAYLILGYVFVAGVVFVVDLYVSSRCRVAVHSEDPELSAFKLAVLWPVSLPLLGLILGAMRLGARVRELGERHRFNAMKRRMDGQERNR